VISAIDDLIAAFTGAGLPTPPVPASLQSSVERRDDWLWATRPVDRLEMYVFREYPAEALRRPVEDYLAISHGGHGANSYSINFHLVLRPLALFTQVLWGGVYVDNDEAVASMTEQFAGIARVIVAAERLIPSFAPDRRLLVLESTFRNAVACQWFVPGDGSAMRFLGEPGKDPSVFDLAIGELSRAGER
jgi:hypothetical protein